MFAFYERLNQMKRKIIILLKAFKNGIRYYKNSKRIKKLRRKGAKIGKNVVIGDNCRIINPRNLYIGDNVYIADNLFANCIGGLRIEDGVIISYNCTVMTFNHDYNDDTLLPYGLDEIKKEVVIKENCWIGINVSICPGVTIGKRSVVGMGSVVPKSLNDNTVFAGGRIIKERPENNTAIHSLLEVRTLYNPFHFLSFNSSFKKAVKNSQGDSVSFDEIMKVYGKDDYISMIYQYSKLKKLEVDYINDVIKLR